jgi:hypothetical protein
LIIGLPRGVCTGTLVLAIAACGSDDRAGFAESSPAPSADGGAGSYDATDPSPRACDPLVLAGKRSLAGCRFVTTSSTFTGFNNVVPAGCHPLIVTNPSNTAAHLRLRFNEREEDAASYSVLAQVSGRDVTYVPLHEGALGPDESAIVSVLFVPSSAQPDINPSFCPTSAFVTGADAAARAESVTSAVELISDAPVLVTGVVAYQRDAKPVGPYPGQAHTAVFPLFPVHLWESAPLETGVFKPGLPAEQSNPDSNGESITFPIMPSRTIVLSASDDTKVSFPLPDGSTRMVDLRSGEAFSHDSNDATIGRTMVATRPVEIVTFAPSATIPWDFPHGAEPDATLTFQPSMPLSLWGSEYVAVRHGDRWEGKPEEPPWRIIGGADDTMLSYEPYHPTGAPDHVRRGELAVFFADLPFVVRSQDERHPFFFGGHMTGAAYQKQRSGMYVVDENIRGRALVVHQLATSRWVRRYPFFTLTRFPSQSLVVMRAKGARDVRLDCAGVLTGWEPVDSRFELVRVRLTDHLFAPITYSAGACETGRHVIESEDAFWATQWAWGSEDTVTQLGLGTDGAYALPLFGIETPPAQQSTH